LTSEKKSKQPNSRHCFVCGVDNPCGLGMRFYGMDQGHVVAEYTVAEQYQGYPGVVHGGVIAAMLDEALGRAAMIEDHNRFWVTAKFEIRYRKPVPVGQPLQIHGRLQNDRGRRILATAELLLPDGSIGAEAEGMLMEVPDQFSSEEQLEALGWKVYPD
jgi:uncharacterized protein (TIGR00369 family)